MGSVIGILIDWAWQVLKGPLAILYGSPSEKFQLPEQVRHEDMLLCKLHSLNDVKKVINLELEDDDVVVASYPKAGTTLLQEIVWLVRSRADIEGSQKAPNIARVPYIDFGFIDTLTAFIELPRPRTMKTHVPWRMLPKGVLKGRNKVVCPLRNPKDTLVSFYHFHRMNGALGHFKGSWDEFFEYFRENGYILAYGNPIDHMLCYWKHRNDDNVLLVFYEEMVSDRLGEVRKIADFLEVDLTDEQVETVAKATGFEVMKSSPFTNYDIAHLLPPGEPFPLKHDISPFMRKGKVGDWKNYFSDEQSRIVDKMCEEKLAGTGLKFRYE